MAANTIKINTFWLSLATVLAIEIAAQWIFHMPGPILSITAVGLIRSIQIFGMLWIVLKLEGGLQSFGLTADSWSAGMKKGMVWSLGFAIVTAIGMGVVQLLGHNPLMLIRTYLPSDPTHRLLFFLVAGFIGPVAEEICFRGIVYGFLRRVGIQLAALVFPSVAVADSDPIGQRIIGVSLAILGSTAIFVALHSFHSIPVPQIVGGIVFAVAYETSRNILVPITIHVLGNLAIFSLSLI